MCVAFIHGEFDISTMELALRIAARQGHAECRRAMAAVSNPRQSVMLRSTLAPSSVRSFSQLVSQPHPSGLSVFGEGKGTGVPFPPSRTPLYQASPLNAFMTKYKYLFSAMGVFSQKARVGNHSESLFRSIEEQATQEAWWSALSLPRTWIAEQALIALHVWIFHNRFKVDYNVPGEFNGRRMQEQLFERFWEDTILRIRNAGIAEISVNKQLESVQKVTFDDMFGYDAAIKVEDDDCMELAAAVWKGVFREDEAADTEAVLKLADYTKREVFNVMLQPAEDVYRGWITWGPVVGESEAARLDRQRRMLEGEWRDAIAQDGRVYFYHTATHERRWQPPEQGLYPRRRFALLRYAEQHPEHSSLLLGQGGTSQAPRIAGPTGSGTQPKQVGHAPHSKAASTFKDKHKADKA